MADSWNDLETFSRVPIKNGSHAYAEQAEVMLWAFADGDGQVYVWDLVNNSLHWCDELSGVWGEATPYGIPHELERMLADPDYLVWFQNGGMFDFVVLHHDQPWFDRLVPQERRRDTMVQAFSHSLPGSLDKLGAILRLDVTKQKDKRGKQLIQLFCVPQKEDFIKKYGTDRATKQTHPKEWQEFIEYAGGDIVTMREAHRKMPKWNYRGKQIDLWHVDMRINNRGFLVDQDLARAAIEVVDKAKAGYSKRTQEITSNQVGAVTQRDEMLKYILEAHGVDLPDMQSDTLERRIQDPDLPEAVKELLKLRLVGSMNSVSKYKSALKAVNSDGRLRGGAQFRGAGRTGRYAHRLFQFGNMPRPTLPHELIDAGALVAPHGFDVLAMVVGEDQIMQWASSAIRGAIIAPKGKKQAVADLSNIEGRAAAWLAGEDWKCQAFRDFDSGMGHDLYIVAYSKSFNVDPDSVPKKGPERQIGKVEELMFQYGGGVGAWLTGAATYGIDLDKMTDQVYPVLPQWAIDEAIGFLEWMYKQADDKHAKALSAETDPEKLLELKEQHEAARLKVRMGLPYRTFVACDAIKRLWRKAHPMISSYWKQLEETVREAIEHPGVTYPCRKVKIRRSGAWLRIALPSGRELCYPDIAVDKKNRITYTGLNQYSRKWEKVHTYGGKLFENITQAVACDQFVECFPLIENAGFEIVVHVHDEVVAEVDEKIPDAHVELARIMCSNLGWNEGLPLAAAGFETRRYRKD